MGLENARDSFVDLLLIKEEKQELQRLLEESNAAGQQSGGDSSPGNSFLKRLTSFRLKPGTVKKGGSSHAAYAAAPAAGGVSDGHGARLGDGDSDGDGLHSSSSPTTGYEALCYEPCDVPEEEEDHCPVWEMTEHDPWRNCPTANSGASAASALSEGRTSSHNIVSIGECERIFTVPEVYEEMQQARYTHMSQMTHRDGGAGIDENDDVPCQSILSCLTPWKQQRMSLTYPRLLASGSLNAISEHSVEDDDVSLGPTGVMKRTSMAVQMYLGMPISVRRSFTPSMFKVQLDEDGNVLDEGGGGGRKKRVSIVGSNNNQKFTMGMEALIEGMKELGKEGEKEKKKKYKVHFSELKRVLRVRKFTPEEALEVWYQRADFDHFKNEMTLLIQEGGASRKLAEAWLEATPSGSQISEADSSEEEKEGADNAEPHSHNRRDSVNSTGSGGSRAWWHDYDHSRRGLERYASPGQARQILKSYKVALTKVLNEQQRQRLLACLFIPRAHDPEKIAEVYHEYTAWSRDLALAAGASDADAVRTNFDDDKRHTREYYMLKQVVISGYKVHKHMPQFMLPKCIIPKGFLDEAESLYLHDKNDSAASTATSLFGSMVAAASQSRKQKISGEEARKEMSQLDSEDLEGPVSPALAASLQTEGSGKNLNSPKGSKIGMSPKQMENRRRKTSLAEKAKNYPFQE